MENWLNAIVAAIASGKLVPALYFQSVDCNAALDARDKNNKDFVAEWTASSRKRNGGWTEAKIPDEQQKYLLKTFVANPSWR